jgi:hypothetical protein
MPRKPKPPADDPAQSKRFIGMAREIGADEGVGGREAFDRTFEKVARTGKRTADADSADHVETWSDADVDKKLELLRQDIKEIATAQNALARDFRDLARRVEGLTKALAASRRKSPQT